MRAERRWAAALDEHERVVRTFAAVCRRIPAGGWHRAPALGKWSPAEVVLHVCRTYEIGEDAFAGGPGMRLRVSPSRARLLRTVLLPLLLGTRRFPPGVLAPEEVAPDAATARQLAPEAAAARLELAARRAAAALQRAAGARPVPRVMHAYFGPLAPYATLRLLSAHTRHHARGLARLASTAAGDG